MPDIVHRVGIKAAAAKVYSALTLQKGLAGWWTDNVIGEPKVGSVLKFRFGDIGYMEMRITVLTSPKKVRWECVNGPKEWVGTILTFDLKVEEGMTIVLFSQREWKKEVEFMYHCSTKWAVFLLSLKQLVETGKGAAYPNDIKIDNWN